MKSVILTIILSSILFAAGIVGGIYWGRTSFDRTLYLTCIDKFDPDIFSAFILGAKSNDKIISSCRAFIVESKMMLENPTRPTESEALEQIRREEAKNKQVYELLSKSVWTVQINAFKRQKDAQSLTKRLKNKGYDAFVVSTKRNGQIWYRVRVGNMETQDEAKRMLDKLKKKENFTKAILAKMPTPDEFLQQRFEQEQGLLPKTPDDVFTQGFQKELEGQ